MKLVDESRIQELLGDADAADHLNCLIAGGSFRSATPDYTPSVEREGQMLVLFRCNAWRMISRRNTARASSLESACYFNPSARIERARSAAHILELGSAAELRPLKQRNGG